jgi:hypothetical protein
MKLITAATCTHPNLNHLPPALIYLLNPSLSCFLVKKNKLKTAAGGDELNRLSRDHWATSSRLLTLVSTISTVQCGWSIHEQFSSRQIE